MTTRSKRIDRTYTRIRWALEIVAAVALVAGLSAHAAGAPTSDVQSRGFALVGFHDLQGRGAYQPVIHEQQGRWIAYVGHNGGDARNALTGRNEANGTSMVDVTDPARPALLHHIPGAADGAQMASAPSITAASCSSHFNAGVRALDIRDPYRPREIAYYVPAGNGRTVNANNVVVDDRGNVYSVDRHGLGMHILTLTGEARAATRLP